MASLPPCPASLKPISHFLKTAVEHDERDQVIPYWSRLYALQTGLKLSSKLPEETALFIAIMDWLEKYKKKHHDNETITNEVVAQAYLENYALKLFTYADNQDKAAIFNKNVVKAYYTAGIIYDILLTFGELSEEASEKRKYAKYKAAYIHNCLKNGEKPIPGPPNENTDENVDENNDANKASAEDTIPPKDPNTADASRNSPIKFKPHIGEINADKLPSPPVDPEGKNPGGFESYVPAPDAAIPLYDPPSTNVALTAEQTTKAQKYCKYAGSALNFDDVQSAIENLEKALHILKTGQEM